MAGDWIPMRLNLAADPAVVAMAAALGLDEYAIVGRLHQVWSWANQHTANGHAPRVTGAWIDRSVNCLGFSAEMQNVGWLILDASGVTFPRFDAWNSNGAKSRIDAAARKRRSRSQNLVTNVTESCDQSVTKEEKRREEKRREEERARAADANDDADNTERGRPAIAVSNDELRERAKRSAAEADANDGLHGLVEAWGEVSQGKAIRAVKPTELFAGFRQLAAIGYTVDEIEAAIRDVRRDVYEWPSNFFERMNAAKRTAGAVNGKAGKPTLKDKALAMIQAEREKGGAT